MAPGMATNTNSGGGGGFDDNDGMSDVMCGDLFDHIEDLLDFSGDDGGGLGGALADHCPPTHHSHSHDDVAAAFPPMLSPPLHHDDGFLVGGPGCVSNGGHGDVNPISALNQEEAKLAPCDELDITQLEWLSNFFDDSSDSFTLDLPNNESVGNDSSANKNGEESFFRTSSPVSVLEPNSLIGVGGGSSSNAAPSSSSSSSCSGVGNSGNGNIRTTPLSPPEAVVTIPGRARSKRSRPAAFPPRPHIAVPILPPSSDPIADLPPLPTMASSEPESFDESDSPLMIMMMPIKKKKKKFHAAFGGDEEATHQAPQVRKCMHCEIQKTPQWRAGPMGPKTLCNACGVRYKSGRLFPEYRPAASPTFVPALHSNSHKKVVEMRIKSTEKTSAPGMPSPENPAAKGCDLLEYIRRRE